jgi:hypothetical protein
MRTIQPPHRSEKFTLAEAMRAWRTVDAENARRAAGRPPRAVRTAQPVRLNARVAADRPREG